MKTDENWHKISLLSTPSREPCFPTFARFAINMLAVPHSTAELKQVFFSQMNLVKTDRKILFLLHDCHSAEPVVGSAEPIYLMCFLVPEAAEQPAFEAAPSPLVKKAPAGREPLSFPILSPEATPQTTSPSNYLSL
ncbi:UNVERIFIED_CONTAM: hypothetical protein FKN15_013695 [Acipenser sinensis]